MNNTTSYIGTVSPETETLPVFDKSAQAGNDDGPTGSEVAEWHITTFSSPIILVIGIIGNILSFIVFSRKALSQSVCSIFFRALAVADLITLLESVEYFFFIWGIDTLSTNTWSCRFSFYITWVAKTCSAWILVIVAMERTTGILFPHLSKSIWTKSRAKMALGLLLLCCMAVYSPFFALYIGRQRYFAVRGGKAPFCGRTPQYVGIYKNIAPWLEICLYSFVPFIFLLSLNVAIAYGLIRAKRRRDKLGSGKGDGQGMTGLTAMLLMTSVAFILMTLPFCIYYLLRQYVIMRDDPWFIKIRPYR